MAKTANWYLKQVNEGVFYRTVRGGFYVGDQQDFAFYRFPSVAELEAQHYSWWRSAQTPNLGLAGHVRYVTLGYDHE